MELKALEDAKKEQEKRKAQQKKVVPKKVEPEKVVPVTRATCKFTAPVIKDDKDVKEEMPPMFKMNNTNKAVGIEDKDLSLIHISEPTRLRQLSRMPSSA